METRQRYFDDLNRLLAAMPPRTIDMGQLEANEQRHRHTFFDPPETVQTWLLDQQRRVQTSHTMLEDMTVRIELVGRKAPDQ